jgi:uncharacterized protein YprB with RNaseH-like and TPR domain
LLRRGDVITNSVGEHLRICLTLEELWPGGTSLVDGRCDFLRQPNAVASDKAGPTATMAAEFAAFAAALPDRVMLLDLETCGLTGSALFLVGILRNVIGSVTVELLVARNYAEEAAVLQSLWQIVQSHDVLVTFNGKSFDWPMVCERTIRHRLGERMTRNIATHIDVLHHARRRWRRQLPDCRLQTLELAVCRRRRTGDIPGHRIPAVYADFVRTGFERDMDLVLYHNAQDLVTLFDLALRLAA